MQVVLVLAAARLTATASQLEPPGRGLGHTTGTPCVSGYTGTVTVTHDLEIHWQMFSGVK